MKLLPGLDVHLTVNGEYLPEFGDDAEGERTHGKRSSYIESTSGSTFTMDIHFGTEFPYMHEAISCAVYMDGKWATGIAPTVSASSQCAIEGVRSSKAGKWTLERFVFADLRTDDGGPRPTIQEAFEDLGTIKVTVIRVRTITTSKDLRKQFEDVGDSVPGKSLKGRAISNHVKLTAAEPIAKIDCLDVTYPHGKEPIAMATYKYRSRRDLQIEGIIPRSPSPVPLEDRDPDSLSAEEARELVRRLRAREIHTKTEIKHEKHDRATIIEDSDGDEDEVTIESETRGRKRVRKVPSPSVEVVDFSAD